VSRPSRSKSASGIYHVMLRGIDRRKIFILEPDYLKFLEYIEKAKNKCAFEVYAYCLMPNHVHLLLKTEKDEEIGNIIKRITVGYVQYHNLHYARTGHLFQNRFRSEPVEDESYFVTVLRYIHQNPLKAGIVKEMEEYQWSSYYEYLKAEQRQLLDPTFVLNFFPNTEAFVKFMKEENEDKCLDDEQIKVYTDEDLKGLITTYLDADLRSIAESDKKRRNELLKNIKEMTGVSNRQLARVLDIGRGIIERV